MKIDAGLMWRISVSEKDLRGRKFNGLGVRV
jgi:hypothetical protein